ncbi:hypothetical protein DNTS_012127 [Danionella cerebrum]|uniref:Uncharacterized protein n=1 Tax=Danionella cerebrum TaxID=2873325 RepID=A0A553PUC6_9TELE|nr:hypothetical protein DNTS_012127 [Danionella translucida]
MTHLGVTRVCHATLRGFRLERAASKRRALVAARAPEGKRHELDGKNALHKPSLETETRLC